VTRTGLSLSLVILAAGASLGTTACGSKDPPPAQQPGAYGAQAGYPQQPGAYPQQPGAYPQQPGQPGAAPAPG
jgi:flagellar basal body L-ring protein FlgH